MRSLRTPLLFVVAVTGCGQTGRLFRPSTKEYTEPRLGREGDAAVTWTREEQLAFIRASDRLVFVFDTWKWHTRDQRDPLALEITERRTVRRIVSLVDLEPTHKCECKMSRTIIFCNGKRSMPFHISSHRLDVWLGQERHRYKMPPELWQTFRDLEEQHTRGLDRAEPSDGSDAATPSEGEGRETE